MAIFLAPSLRPGLPEGRRIVSSMTVIRKLVTIKMTNDSRKRNYWQSTETYFHVIVLGFKSSHPWN